MVENEVVGNLREELLKAKSELNAHGGIEHAQQARQYDKIIQNLTDEKDQLEMDELQLRNDHRTIKLKYDTIEYKLQNMEKLNKTLQIRNDSEVQHRYIDLAREVENIKLENFREKREKEELEE